MKCEMEAEAGRFGSGRMRYAFLFFFIFLISAADVAAQPGITTFILVRHAEKANDGSKDPELSEAGKHRAEALATLLSKSTVAAIYSTAFKRTRQTMMPLAQQKVMAVMDYDPSAIASSIEKMLTAHTGKTIVVCGHSNTIPAMLNYLTGTNDYKNFDDGDYGNLVIISVTSVGHASVTWLTY